MSAPQRGVRPIPFDLLTSIFDRPPVTRAPANDFLDKDADDMAFVAYALGSLTLLLGIVVYFA
jgi:hypothetical protein